MRLFFTIATVFAASIALAAQPSLELKSDVPSPKVGDLVTVTAVSPDAKSIRIKVVGDASYKMDSSGRSVHIVPRGKVVVLGVASDAQGELSDIVELVLTPNGDVTPVPPVPPDPTPIVTDTAMYIVVVEETSEAAATRGALFANKDLAARVKEMKHRWRIVDKDVVGSDGKPPQDIVRFLDEAKGKALPQVFLVDEDGKVRYKGDMPTKADELLKLLKKYGG